MSSSPFLPRMTTLPSLVNRTLLPLGRPLPLTTPQVPTILSLAESLSPAPAWPVLAEGAWVPVVLLMLVGALAWSRISPGPCTCLGFVTLPNFWWQLGAVGGLVALALFCGWLQGLLGWAPEEVNLEPPSAPH